MPQADQIDLRATDHNHVLIYRIDFSFHIVDFNNKLLWNTTMQLQVQPFAHVSAPVAIWKKSVIHFQYFYQPHTLIHIYHRP